MIIAGPQETSDPSALLALLLTHGISALTLLPSLLQLLVADERFKACTSLRHVTCFGEPLAADLEEAFSNISAAQLFVVYGTTEVPGLALRACRPDGPRAMGNLGYPIGDSEICILDSHRQPVPIGVPGELYGGGPSLGMGYLNSPRHAEERFIPHPFDRSTGCPTLSNRRPGALVHRWIAGIPGPDG